MDKLEIEVEAQAETAEHAIEHLPWVDEGRRDLKAEHLADGWVVTMRGGEWGDAFPVIGQRTIAGVRLSVWVDATSLASQAEAGRAWKSLRVRPAD